jgi:hypothetical protein
MPKSLWDKVKDVDEAFATEVYSLTDEQLKEKLVNFANEQQLYEDKKAADVDLKRLTEERKTVADTYDIPLKGIKLKRQLTIRILRERGKLSDLEK